jgi:hypothetical protein
MFFCFSGVCRRSGSVRQILTDILGNSYSEARSWVDSQVFEPPSNTATPVGEIQGRNPAVLGLYNRCSTYMLRRGFDKETLRIWDVGFDRMRKSVTIPVWTPDGKFVGLSRRTVLPDYEPRYWHDFEHGVRKQVLYGENMLTPISESNPVIVTEAQLSTVWNYQWGFFNSVATLGSKVSREQISRISKFPYVLLAFDGDVAGIEATNRLLYGWSSSYKGKDSSVPGLVQRMDKNRIKVVSGWGNYDNKDKPGFKAKDPQEVEPRNLTDLYGTAVPWQLWDFATGGPLTISVDEE